MSRITQILSNESLNDCGFVVLSDGIDWSRYEKNPVLLESHDWNSQPIGNVINIHRVGSDWVGELKFAEGTERGKTAKYLYENGFYRAVSIGGPCTLVEDPDTGTKFATKFLVYEVSLVPLPSNSGAVSDFKGDRVMLATEFHASQSETIATLSANDLSIINKHKEKMNQEEQIKNSAEAPEMKEQPKEAEEVKTLGSAAEDGIVDKIVARLSSIFSGAKSVPTDDGARPDPESSPKKDSEVESATLGTKAEAAPERKEPEPAKLGAEGEGNLLDPHRINLKASVEATKTLHQFLASPEGKAKFNGAARLLAVSPSEVARPEHTAKLEAAREFVNIVKSDEGFMAFMGNINVLNANGRYEKLSTLVERAVVKLASGANSIDFVTSTPDLAVVEWLSLFYRQLLPANSWADRCARMSGSDKQGIIWVESAMKPKIYFGDRAPLNVADYLYDDDPVGLVTKVFSLQPVLWQAANTDILAYDDRSWGQSEAVRFMVNAIHNFALQKIAETAGGKVEMSGLAPDGTTVRTFNAKDAFPINSAATGTLHQMSPKDLTRAQSQFINWNYDITEGSLDLVMDAAYYEQLFSDPYLTSLLTKTAGSMRPMLGQYSAFNFMARSTTAAYDTASSRVVDAELYCDGKVSADGTIPTYTPPVLAATAYGMGIGFIPSQVILAMGNVNMHVVADPNSYGWKFSMEMRFGAGAARKGGKGIVNFVPKVYTAPSGD